MVCAKLSSRWSQLIIADTKNELGMVCWCDLLVRMPTQSNFGMNILYLYHYVECINHISKSTRERAHEWGCRAVLKLSTDLADTISCSSWFQWITVLTKNEFLDCSFVRYVVSSAFTLFLNEFTTNVYYQLWSGQSVRFNKPFGFAF